MLKSNLLTTANELRNFEKQWVGHTWPHSFESPPHIMRCKPWPVLSFV